MRTSTIIETVEIVIICFGIVYVVISAYKKGYNDRSKEIETDFDFDKKEKEEVKCTQTLTER